MKIFQDYEILFQKIQCGDTKGIEIAEYKCVYVCVVTMAEVGAP
jgi:hypothetical protein